MNKLILLLILLSANVFAGGPPPTIQQHIDTYSMSECAEALEYYQSARDANPDEDYFEFMLEKWQDRCFK